LFSHLLLATVALTPILSVPDEVAMPIHTYIDYSHERVIVYPSLLTELPTLPPDKVAVKPKKKPFSVRHPKISRGWKHVHDFCNEVGPVVGFCGSAISVATFLSVYLATRR
jgi:hypothetical protein